MKFRTYGNELLQYAGRATSGGMTRRNRSIAPTRAITRAVTDSPMFEKTKLIDYGTTDQIYSASGTVAADEPSGYLPKSIEVSNNGLVPLTIFVGYETF